MEREKNKQHGPDGKERREDKGRERGGKGEGRDEGSTEMRRCARPPPPNGNQLIHSAPWAFKQKLPAWQRRAF